MLFLKANVTDWRESQRCLANKPKNFYQEKSKVKPRSKILVTSVKGHFRFKHLAFLRKQSASSTVNNCSLSFHLRGIDMGCHLLGSYWAALSVYRCPVEGRKKRWTWHFLEIKHHCKLIFLPEKCTWFLFNLNKTIGSSKSSSNSAKEAQHIERGHHC